MKATVQSLFALLAFGHSLAAAPLLSRGHTDVGIAYEGNVLEPHIHAEEYDLEYAPDAAILRVLPQAEEVVPAAPAFSFLGSPGAPTWILPQDEATATAKDILLLGLGAEEIDPALFSGNLNVNLTNVSFAPEPGGGPAGNFAMFTTGSGGSPTILMSTHDGIDAADVATVIPGTHFDPNWAFSQPGRYQITFVISGTLAGGGTSSAQATYTFVVKSFSSAQATQLAKNEVIAVGSDFALVTRSSALSIAPSGGGLAVLGIKGFGASATTINKTNDTVLAHLADYKATVLAREGEGVFGLPGVQLRAFNDGFVTDSGQCAFSAMLLIGPGGVTKFDDTILLSRVYDATNDQFIHAPLAREGGPVPGLAGFAWTKFLSYLPAEDGSVVVVGHAKNPVTTINKTVAVRAVPNGLGFDVGVLVSTREPMVTDSGPHVVKSITRPTKPGTRAVDQQGGVELLLGLDDGTFELVRFR